MSTLVYPLLAVLFAAPDADVRRAADGVLDADVYQRDLELGEIGSGTAGGGVTGGGSELGSGAGGDWRQRKRRRGDGGEYGEAREPAHRGGIEIPVGIAHLFRAVTYILIAAGVVLLLYLLFDQLRGLKGGGGAGKESDPNSRVRAEEAEQVIERPLADAQALAAQGRYAEAIHILLLRTLEELRRLSARELPIAYTSREILDRVPLPGGARAELSGLVDTVEWSLFGGHEPDRSHYEVCLGRFQRFADAYRTGGAG